MPLFETVRLNSDVRNFGEYFAALQGVLDVVKFHMSEGMWEYGGGLSQRINRYTTREYDGVEEFFVPYVNDILSTVRYLEEEHGDGRLFKMFEDTILALVVKNYMEYDYVVGNPPYVRIQNLPDGQKAMLDQLYESTTGNYDLYCPFYERGLDWLKEGSGKLGFITPNQFMNTDYGEGLRRVLLNEARIEEVYDFRDSGVFADAKNYPAIVILEEESDSSERETNSIRCVRVKADTKAPTNRDLDTEVVEAVRNHRDDPGYKDDLIDVFDYPQGDLDDGYWSLMPPEELDIIHKMNVASDGTVGDVTDSVFVGTQTSANNVFLVTPVDADRIGADDTNGTVTVVPKGEEQEYEIETTTLRPWLQGRDINRWRGDWSGEHAIVPYTIERNSDGRLTSNIISQEQLENDLPLTWTYLTEHRDILEGRDGGRFKDRDDWYGFGRPQNLTRFEDPKLICPEIAAEATFMVDNVGTWYFKSAYGVQLKDEFRDRTEIFAALLNSNALDFYLKHYTTLKVDGYYKSTTNYLTPLPISWGDDDCRTQIQNLISTITAALDTSSKIERFPEAYLGEYDGELEYITYEWQTRRYPVNAEVNEANSGFTVQAGRSDVIADAAMHTADPDMRKRRATYVCEAVNGRNVKSGETTTIPIPRSDNGVDTLLKARQLDETIVSETDLNDLEEQINEIVYNMFDITLEEQRVIEEYLDTFRVY
ncbi:Eco57I restriction-modification methylase domain-containing protein [Halalkalicoccus subterraneus]|uniref:Eco57I restriction-modification methylase domain-containing protein n=1 Tax=Halalkalicoccus subterraneus TaxID=2675002 RepID=UPI000EFC7369|nr:TaqI-like C-terminal specificity domain-containing protein [Halalkalicoccus subterraneus]